MIKIGPASKNSDLPGIIKLIYETDDYIYPSMCGNDYELFEMIMRGLLFTESIFSYRNIIIATENGKTIGLLLYFRNDGKLPEAIDKCVTMNEGQLINYNYVINKYFAPLVSKINNNCLYINNLCVEKERRQCGVATMLVNHLKETFPDEMLILDCLEENISAVNLYEKTGFKKTDRFFGFSGNQEEQVACLKFEF